MCSKLHPSAQMSYEALHSKQNFHEILTHPKATQENLHTVVDAKMRVITVMTSHGNRIQQNVRSSG